MRLPHPSNPTCAMLAGLGLLAGCSGSSASAGAGPTGVQTGFELLSISVANNSIMPLNRGIRLSFSSPVDFCSVSNLSIPISNEVGTNAMGSFGPLMLDTDADGIPDTADPRVVHWQPACPTRQDLSDSGLLPASAYTLQVRGLDSGAGLVLQGENGGKLQSSTARQFRTPNSSEVQILFEDSVAGAPLPRVRPLGSLQQDGVSYVELGGAADPNSRLYFERDPLATGSIVVPGSNVQRGIEAPPNPFRDESLSVAFLIALNQSVNPSDANLSNRFVQLEYLLSGAGSSWTGMDTRVQLLRNCGPEGTLLRLSPGGLLPAGSQVRAVLRSGFQGLGGAFDAVKQDHVSFAVLKIQDLDHATLFNPGLGADELFEDFDVGGSAPDSMQSDGASLALPTADWGQGVLASSLNFAGTGGEGGEFDWIVSGNPEPFDTSLQTIIGGPDGMRSFEQIVVGGVVDVHDFIILPKAALRVTGPNAFVVNASGEIRIEGLLDISGYSARDVATLNTGSQPETGGAGNCGGGAGGGASSVRGDSTPRGDPGASPFDIGFSGGLGGESGFGWSGLGPNNRRPGGGGGGRFARNQSDVDAAGFSGTVPSQGMLAKRGGQGHQNSEGAISGLRPAPGGPAGVGPFVDGDPSNDFLGLGVATDVAILADGTAPVLVSRGAMLRGELSSIHAGYGGAGGGDSLGGDRFPTPNWTVMSDQKGGGGGGGGGGIRLRALGPIRFVGPTSRLQCGGGTGATGENRVGGVGGSGSGGHVILESASRISFELPPLADRASNERRRVFVDARGGAERQGILTNVSTGGQGGPGVIQLHVPNALAPAHENASLSDLVLPVGTIEELNAGDTNALLEVMRPAGVQLLSNFGGLSGAQSRWIDMRTAGLNPDGSHNLLRFLFKGIDPSSGSVLSQNERVLTQTALLSGALDGNHAAFLGEDGLLLTGSLIQELVNSSEPISNDIYLRSPALLRDFLLRILPSAGPTLDFVVQDAAFDAGSQSLSLRVAVASGIELGDFREAPVAPRFELLPRFFAIASSGELNALSVDHDVRISFDAARAGADGNADENDLLLQGTSNFADFDALAPGQLKFIRFNVVFDLDARGAGVSLDSPTLALDFLRLPFLY